MRKNYEMTKEQLAAIMKACQPVPLIALQCGMPPSAQEMANIAWQSLGKEMGFDSMTVEPLWDQGERFFSAVSN